MAAHLEPSEKQPLLSESGRVQNWAPTDKYSHSHGAVSRTASTSSNLDVRLLPSLPLRTKVILAMVAIPAYLLASTALSSIRSLMTRDNASRSPQSIPDSEPQNLSTAEDHSSSSPFGSVTGPLVLTNFPDPAIIHVDGVSYAFATNNRGSPDDLIRVQVATSEDNQTWTLLQRHDALPEVAAWETGIRVWAPDVVQLDDGSFVLYYCDEVASSPTHHCLGAATSKSVLGPYTPLGYPLACPDPSSQGGAIDPDGFHDPSTGKRYIVYKIDGNSLGHGGSCNNGIPPLMPTPLMLQEVDSRDGITPVGEPVQILDRDALDGPLIEAPSLHRSAEGIYFLFYSSNCFTTPLYDIGYATATDIKGPYTRAGRPLLVTSDANLVGPGGLDIIRGGDLIVFHGHLTVDNDPAMRRGQEKTKGHLPLVRGMWAARAKFDGLEVSLA